VSGIIVREIGRAQALCELPAEMRNPDHDGHDSGLKADSIPE
jgi:hypothetical protein